MNINVGLTKTKTSATSKEHGATTGKRKNTKEKNVYNTEKSECRSASSTRKGITGRAKWRMRSGKMLWERMHEKHSFVDPDRCF